MHFEAGLTAASFVRRIIFTALAIVCVASGNSADVPARINYQARFTDTAGLPITGTHTVFFSIYQGGLANSAGSGALVYRESASLTFNNGLLNHEIGTGSNIIGGSISVDTVDFDGDVFVEVAVDSLANTVLPRSRLDSVPYSLQSEEAGRADRVVHDYVVADFSEPVVPGEVVALLGTKIGHFISAPGSQFTFNSNATSHCAVTNLSGSKFVVIYVDDSNSNTLTASVGTLSNGVITFGAPVGIAASIVRCAITTLDGTHVLVVFSNGSSGNASVGTIDADSVSFGPSQGFSNSGTSGLSTSAISASSALIAWVEDNDSFAGMAAVATISGDTVTFGFAPKFNMTSTSSPNIAHTVASQFVLAFCDGSNAGYAAYGTISGTSITLGQNNPFNYGLTSSIDIQVISATQIVIAFVDDAHSGFGRITGGQLFTGVKTIGFGTPDTFNAALTGEASVDSGVIAFRDNGDSNKGKYVIFTPNTSTHTFSFTSEGTFNNGATSSIWVQGGIIAFRDDGDSGFGKAMTIGTNPSTAIAGISQRSGQPGQMVPVAIGGISNAHTGLVPGALYFTTGKDDALTTSTGGIRVGRAVSTTEMQLDPTMSFQ